MGWITIPGKVKMQVCILCVYVCKTLIYLEGICPKLTKSKGKMVIKQLMVLKKNAIITWIKW